MIKLIKNLFKKKEIVKETVKLENLFDWFSNKVKQEIEIINKEIKEETKNLTNEIKVLEKSLKILENAEPDKKLNIMPKVKQTVAGHRANYIRRIRLFIERSKLPETIDYISVQPYFVIIDEELDHIAKTTMKSYYATQHLFYKELEEVTKGLKNVAISISKIKKLTKDTRIQTLGEIKKDIKEVEKGKTMVADIKIEVENIKEKKKALHKLMAETVKKLKEISEGEEYKEYNKLLIRKKNVEDKKRLEESKLFNLFSPLDASLKKYERIAVEDIKLVGEYLIYPLKALKQDKELKIINILGNIKKNIENDSIELKDKKKIKTLQIINKITKEYIRNFVKEYRLIEIELEEIKRDILSAVQVVEREKKIKTKLKMIEEDIELTDTRMMTLDGKTKGMAFDKTKHDLISGVKEILDIELTIK